MAKEYTAGDGTKIRKGDASGGAKPKGVYTAEDGTEFDTRRRKPGKGCLLAILCVLIPLFALMSRLCVSMAS